MKLGIQMGYWMAEPKLDIVEIAQRAESMGYDSLWTGESYSSDGFSPLVYAAAHTERIKLATGIAQMAARTPASMAMHAMTLDALSGGRFMLGIGVSGPQVVEGWYGQPFGKPLARTREYIKIMRDIWRREGPVRSPRAPLSAPLSSRCNRLTWARETHQAHHHSSSLPRSPSCSAPRAQRTSVSAWSIARAGCPFTTRLNDPRCTAHLSKIAQTTLRSQSTSASLSPRTHPKQSRLPSRAEGHARVLHRGAWERSPRTSHRTHGAYGLRGRGQQDPRTLPRGQTRGGVPCGARGVSCDEISLVGPVERIRDKLEAWNESPVTTMVFGGLDPTTMQTMAELVLG